MSENHRLEMILTGIGSEPVPQEIHQLAESVTDEFRRGLLAGADGDDSTLTADSSPPAIRRVPDVPNESADGVRRGTDPMEQPPGSRHAQRRFVAMVERKTVRWLVARPVKAFAGLAARAALIAAVWIVAGGDGAQEALAAAMAGVEKARTFSCKESWSYEEAPVSERFTAFKEPDLERSEWLSGSPYTGEVTITDYAKRRRLAFMPATKTASLEDIGAEYVVKGGSGELRQTRLNTSIRDRVLRGQTAPVEDLGTVDLEGQSVRLVQRRYGPDDGTVKVWIDPQTKLPVQILMERPIGFYKYSSIKIDAELDDALFSLEPPAGYALAQGGLHKPVPDEQAELLAKMRHLLESLHMYAKKHEGFPKALSDLEADGMTPETLKAVLAPAGQPDGAALIRYREPPGKAPGNAVVLYQAFDQWPQGGIWVGFGDGHCRKLAKQEEFEALMR